jgi:hypothetical protein
LAINILQRWSSGRVASESPIDTPSDVGLKPVYVQSESPQRG